MPLMSLVPAEEEETIIELDVYFTFILACRRIPFSFFTFKRKKGKFISRITAHTQVTSTLHGELLYNT
jgi:hypothetical protein